MDAAKNISSSAYDSILYVDNDTTAPALSNFYIYGVTTDNSSALDNDTQVDNASYTNRQDYVFRVTYSDVGGVQGYIVSENASYAPADNASFTWSDVDNVSSGDKSNGTFIGKGSFDNASIDGVPKQVYLWVKDGAGNIAVMTTGDNDTILFDNEAPKFTNPISIHTDNVTQVGSGNYTNSMTIDLNPITYTDNGTGNVAFGLYLSDNSTAPATDNASGIWRSLDNLTFTFASDTNEVKTIYAWLLDNATNLSSSSTVSVTFDNVSPVLNGGALALDNTSDNTSHYIFRFAGTDNYTSDALSPIYAYYVADNLTYQATDDNITAVPASSWDNLSVPDNSSISENMTYLQTAVTGGTSGDKLTIYVWFKDAAENILTDNFTLQAGKYFTN